MGRIEVDLKTSDDTFQFGVKLAKELKRPAILAIEGPLGAGKTTLVQGLAKGLGIEESIQSPTFVILNEYASLAHFDLYRLKSQEDFFAMGFSDYFDKPIITAIEWPGIIQSALPKDAIHIELLYRGNQRILRMSK